MLTNITVGVIPSRDGRQFLVVTILLKLLTVLSLQQSSLCSERTSGPVLLTETAFHLIIVSISLQHHYLVIFFVSFVISYSYHL